MTQRTHRAPPRTKRIGPFLAAWVLVMALGVAPAGAEAAPGASPAILLSPRMGPPTTTVGVQGRGFGPSETVELSFDGTQVATAATDPTGEFSGQVPVPPSALPGPHPVTATGESSGLTAGAPFLVRTDWPKYRFDLTNTGVNPYENVLSPSTVGGLAPRWIVPTPANVIGDPVEVGGVIYAGTDEPPTANGAYVFAADALTGRVQWIYEDLNGLDPSGVVVSHGVVYVSMLGDHALHALDARTGTQLWAAPGPTGTPAVAGGVVYAGSDAGYVYAIDARTGTQLWAARIAVVIGTSPALVGGVLYIGGAGADDVLAVRASDGTVIWSFKTGGSVYSSPAVVDGVVYVGSNDGDVYALDAGTGTLRWRAATGAAVETAPAVAHGLVYAGSNDFNLYAFDAATGALVWEAPTQNGITIQSPVVANGVVYQGSNDDSVYAFDAATGAKLWSYTTGNVIGTDAVVVNGWVYVGSEDDNLYAFGLPG